MRESPPPYRRAPDDVRERVLRRVLEGIEQDAGPSVVDRGVPAPARAVDADRGAQRRWLPAAVAVVAVVAVLLVATLSMRPAGRGAPAAGGEPEAGSDSLLDCVAASMPGYRMFAAVVGQARIPAPGAPSDLWRQVTNSTQPAAVAAIRPDGAAAGLCAVEQGRTAYATGAIPADRTTSVVVAAVGTQSAGGGSATRPTALVALAVNTRSVAVGAELSPLCAIVDRAVSPPGFPPSDGLALCTRDGPGPMDIVVISFSGSRTVLTVR